MIDIKTTAKLSNATNGGVVLRIPKGIKDLMGIEAGQTAVITADKSGEKITIEIRRR